MADPAGLRILSLCSGLSGLDLGVQLAAPGARVLCHVERDAYCAAVLLARMEDSSLERASIWCGDLREFDGTEWRGRVDLVTAGWPCQPFSVAGRRGGIEDERHLWPEVYRALQECDAPLLFGENVRGHLSLGFSDVLGDLAAVGFDAAWGCFTASEVGAPHRRERLFVLAHRDGAGEELGDARSPRLPQRRRTGERRTGQPELEHAGAQLGGGMGWPPGPDDREGWAYVIERWPWLAPATLADAAEREEGAARGGKPARRAAEGATPQPGVRDLAARLPGLLDVSRADRIRALGNAVVPDQAALAFTELSRRLR